MISKMEQVVPALGPHGSAKSAESTPIPLLPAVTPCLAKGHPGRPCKLADPERRKTLLEALAVGHTRKAACAYAGLSEDALARYRAEHEDFELDVRQAEAQAVSLYVGQILRAADKDWRAAAWLLERRHPEEFGRKNRRS